MNEEIDAVGVAKSGDTMPTSSAEPVEDFSPESATSALWNATVNSSPGKLRANVMGGRRVPLTAEQIQQSVEHDAYVENVHKARIRTASWYVIALVLMVAFLAVSAAALFALYQLVFNPEWIKSHSELMTLLHTALAVAGTMIVQRFDGHIFGGDKK